MAATVEDVLIGVGFQLNEASKRNAAAQIKNLKSMANKALGALGLTVSVVAISKFAQDCRQVASDAQQMKSKFEAVFGDMSDTYKGFAEEYASTVGRSTNKVMKYLADTQNLVAGFMITDITNAEQTAKEREAAAEMSRSIMELSMNLAAFANMDEDRAMESTTKAIMGQAEAAKTMGTVLNDDTKATAMMRHEQDLLAKGIDISGKKYKDLTQAQKMWVNYYAMVDQSPDAMFQQDENGNAVGAAIAERNSFESQTRRMASLAEEAKVTVGEFLLPFMSKSVAFGGNMVQYATKFVKKLGNVNDENSKAARLLKAYSSVFDLVERVVTGITEKISTAVDKLGIVDHVADVADRISRFMTTMDPAFNMVGRMVKLLIASWKQFIETGGSSDNAVNVLLEKMGLDPAKVRATILEIQEIFDSVFGNISKLLSGEISFSELGNKIIQDLANVDWGVITKNLWEGFKVLFAKLPKGLKTALAVGGGVSLFGGLLKSIPMVLKIFDIGKKASSLLGLGTIFGRLGKILGGVFKIFINVGDGIISFFLAPLQMLFPRFFNALDTVLTGIFNFGGGVGKIIGKIIKFPGTIALIITAVLDLISFMSGGSSIVGGIIEKFGGDAEGLRERIKSALGAIKDAFGGLITKVSGGVKEIWSVHGERITKFLSFIYSLVVAVVTGVLEAVGPLIDTISDIIQLFTDFFTGNWSALGGDLMAIFGDVGETIGTFASGVIGAFEDIFGLDIGGWFSEAGKKIKGVFEDIGNAWMFATTHDTAYLDALIHKDKDTGENTSGVTPASAPSGTATSTGMIHSPRATAMTVPSEELLRQQTAFYDVSQSAADAQKSVSASTEAMKTDTTSKLGQTAREGTQAIEPLFDDIKQASADAYMWGQELPTNYAKGITDNLDPLTQAMMEFSLATSGWIHFSLPDFGPLRNIGKWGAELVEMYAGSINSRLPVLKSAAIGMANVLSSPQAQALAGNGNPSLAMAGGGSYVVNQYITFSNSFSGTSAENQKQAAAQMNKNAQDVTTYMANAMSYGR